MEEQNELEKINFAKQPDGKVEDVEFSEELADEADRQAARRAAEADKRVQEQ